MALSTRQQLEMDLARFMKQWIGWNLEDVRQDLKGNTDEQVVQVYRQAKQSYGDVYQFRYNP